MFNKEKDPILLNFEKEKRRRKRKEYIDSATSFVRDNWIWLSAVGAGAITLTTKCVSAYRTHADIRFKQRTIYDHSFGRYVELKRPLTSAQALTIEERRAGGEKLHMILADMGLLKR